MQKKYQVFISSTYTDLVQERNELTKAILDLGHIPAGMELFGAADEEQFDYIKRIIDECDYYVLIIAGRYGSVDQDGIGFTEKEFDYAAASGKTVLVFVHSNPSSLPVVKTDTDQSKLKQLEAFRHKARSGRLVSFWEDVKDLKANAIIALTKAFGQKPGVGWIRGDAAASDDLLVRVNLLSEQNEKLKRENDTLKAHTAPAIENLAGLEEEFSFDYGYTDHSNNRCKGRHTIS